MRKGSGSAVAAAALWLAVGPAAAMAPEVPAPGSDRAYVYLYRTPTLFNSARQASFYIDGEKVVDLWSGGCVRVAVTPGPHLLEEQWKAIPLLDIGQKLTSKDERVAVRDTWAAGGVYFYRLNIWSEMGSSFNEQVIHWDLRPNNPAAALAKVSKCKPMTWNSPGLMERPGLSQPESH